MKLIQLLLTGALLLIVACQTENKGSASAVSTPPTSTVDSNLENSAYAANIVAGSPKISIPPTVREVRIGRVSFGVAENGTVTYMRDMMVELTLCDSRLHNVRGGDRGGCLIYNDFHFPIFGGVASMPEYQKGGLRRDEFDAWALAQLSVIQRMLNVGKTSEARQKGIKSQW